MNGREDNLRAELGKLEAFADQRGPGELATKLNANVLRGLLACFDKPYATAYEPPCVDLSVVEAVNAEANAGKQAK